MFNPSPEEVDEFYMSEADFDDVCTSIEQAWLDAGMPDNYEDVIYDDDDNEAEISFRHVVADDGNTYARMSVVVASTGYVLLNTNITLLEV